MIPAATIQCTAPQIDWSFTLHLPNARHLYWVDLTDCNVSTICFLKFLPDLEILNLSGCRKLIDEDFVVLNECEKLD